jgi:triosephosphate isomerase
MVEIFVNLKRFDVPRELGGVCKQRDPKRWIEGVIGGVKESGLTRNERLHLTFLLPEALLIPAIECMRSFPPSDRTTLDIGCQSVYRENVAPGGNFGAFTSLLPAAAASNMGCTWTMVGHSEERKDKFEVMAAYDPHIGESSAAAGNAHEAIDTLLNRAALKALESGLNVLFCIGETAEERGVGTFAEQKPLIRKVLKSQLTHGLNDAGRYGRARRIAIAYEPRWAIGPGKTPPGADYIEFVSAFVKEETGKILGFRPPVVYGGGLKEENAAEIAGVKHIDGGLVALTRFTGEIGFNPQDLKSIIEKYLSAL